MKIHFAPLLLIFNAYLSYTLRDEDSLASMGCTLLASEACQ